MIDNTFVQADGPLYTDREEALKAPGALFIHKKKGGIYRRMGFIKYAGDKCAKEIGDGPMAVYEHLWPYEHSFFGRLDSEFEEIVTTDHGTHPRFIKV